MSKPNPERAFDEDRGAERLPAVIVAPLLPRSLEAEIEAVRAYAAASPSAATRRVYLSDWAIFIGWCDARGIEPLPGTPAALATFSPARQLAG